MQKSEETMETLQALPWLETMKLQNPEYAKDTFAILNWKMYGFLLENFYFFMRKNNIMKQLCWEVLLRSIL